MKKLLLILLFIPLLFSCNLDADMGIFQDVLQSQKVDSTEISNFIGQIGDTSYVATQKGIQSFNGSDSTTIYTSDDARIYGAVLTSDNSGIVYLTYSTTTAEGAPKDYTYNYIGLNVENHATIDFETLFPGFEPVSVNANGALFFDKVAKEASLFSFTSTGATKGLSKVIDNKDTDRPNPVQGGFSYLDNTDTDGKYTSYIYTDTDIVKVSFTPGTDEPKDFGKLLGCFKTSKGYYAISNATISDTDSDITLWKIADDGTADFLIVLSKTSSFNPIAMFETKNNDKAVLAFFSPIISQTGTSMTSVLLNDTFDKDNDVKEVPLNRLSSSTEIVAYAKLADGATTRVVTVDTGYYYIDKLVTDGMKK